MGEDCLMARLQDDSGKLIEISYVCSADNTYQNAYIQKAFGSEPRPLVVALHTWSCDWRDHPDLYGACCRKWNWHYIYPDFRGWNRNSMACGSEFAVQDIVDAVSFMKKIVNVDSDRIFLCGGSGGGYASLLLAGRHPELWTAVSCWCPISDLTKWHAQTAASKDWTRYAREIELVCGGDPETNPYAAREARARSAATYLKNAADIPVDINTGIHDGHQGSVPVSQAIEAYNLLCRPEDVISQADMDFIVKNELIPEHLRNHECENLMYGPEHPVLMRCVSGNVRLTLFEGAHHILPENSFAWFSRQKRGCSPEWSAELPDDEMIKSSASILHE